MLPSPLKKLKSKRNFFLLLLLVFAALCTSAQRINENTIVKDSSGNIYSAAIWRALLLKGGHTLKAENRNDPNTAYFIVTLSDEEKNARLTKMPQPRESPFFKKGDQVKFGRITDMQGNKIDLRNNEGKITVINFWFINCSPCRLEIPDLNTLAKKYASDTVRFVAIALDEKYALKEFLHVMPFDYQIIDNGRTLADRYGVKSYPTHVILDQEGKVYFHTTGLSTNTVYWIEKCIKELINKPVTTSMASQ